MRCCTLGAVSAVLHMHLDPDEFMDKSDNISELQRLSVVPLGFVSFIVTFRTSACYARWWEGRCLWGALLFACIHLSQQGFQKRIPSSVSGVA